MVVPRGAGDPDGARNQARGRDLTEVEVLRDTVNAVFDHEVRALDPAVFVSGAGLVGALGAARSPEHGEVRSHVASPGLDVHIRDEELAGVARRRDRRRVDLEGRRVRVRRDAHGLGGRRGGVAFDVAHGHGHGRGGHRVLEDHLLRLRLVRRNIVGLTVNGDGCLAPSTAARRADRPRNEDLRHDNALPFPAFGGHGDHRLVRGNV